MASATSRSAIDSGNVEISINGKDWKLHDFGIGREL